MTTKLQQLELLMRLVHADFIDQMERFHKAKKAGHASAMLEQMKLMCMRQEGMLAFDNLFVRDLWHKTDDFLRDNLLHLARASKYETIKALVKDIDEENTKGI